MPMLHVFIEQHRAEIVRRCSAKVAGRSLAAEPTAGASNGNPGAVAVFLEHLIEALRGGHETLNAEIVDGALLHGHDLMRQGLTVSEVVHTYGDICQSVTELAVEVDESITTDDFRTFNRCLDDAIAAAVTEFSRASAEAGADAERARERHRTGFFAHELRNLVDTATMAFSVLKTGNVAVAGSTAAVVDRSLSSVRALITRSLAEVRLTGGIQQRERLPIAELFAELAADAALSADARGVTLIVEPVDEGLAVEADRQVLSAVVANLLQNAFKFTRPRTTVTLRAGASTERILIEVEDECGGLPGGDAESERLFRPFEQRGADRSGVGIGLAFGRWGAEANNGRLYAHNRGQGCVFTVDLPRVAFERLARA